MWGYVRRSPIRVVVAGARRRAHGRRYSSLTAHTCRMSDPRDALEAIHPEVVSCRACPRLVEWRELTARTKRAAFADQDYWARPVPGWGDPAATVLVVGLAPAAHGGNRTGRIFTGDRSGDWLFASLFRCGVANQPRSLHRDDGLQLRGVYVSAAVKCAPPGNHPSPSERDRCLPYLVREVRALPRVRVAVALGAFAWDAVLRVVAELQGARVRPRPCFGHGAEANLDVLRLIGSYHPSQQNTFTGKLTEEMLDRIFMRALEIAA
jgi:uracil-DNA glycosylase family 4